MQLPRNPSAIQMELWKVFVLTARKLKDDWKGNLTEATMQAGGFCGNRIMLEELQGRVASLEVKLNDIAASQAEVLRTLRAMRDENRNVRPRAE